MESETAPAVLDLSPLGHTWFLDLDGTLLKHNGYLVDGEDTLLDGAPAFLAQIPAGDLVVLVTARGEQWRAATEGFLTAHGVRFDQLICGAPHGERIVVNDAKPSGLPTALAVTVDRDRGPAVTVRIDPDL